MSEAGLHRAAEETCHQDEDRQDMKRCEKAHPGPAAVRMATAFA
jgi:hypothetical protein